MGTLGTTVAVSAPNNQQLGEPINSLSMTQNNSLLTTTQVEGKSVLLIEIETVADTYGINKKKFYELAKCESSLKQDGECGDGGKSCGIYQFQQPTWDENCYGDRNNISEQIKCAAKLISRGEIWRWPTCRTKVGL
jgi:hypothetical protein